MGNFRVRWLCRESVRGLSTDMREGLQVIAAVGQGVDVWVIYGNTELFRSKPYVLFGYFPKIYALHPTLHIVGMNNILQMRTHSTTREKFNVAQYVLHGYSLCNCYLEHHRICALDR